MLHQQKSVLLCYCACMVTAWLTECSCMCPNLACWCFQSCTCPSQSSRVDGLHSRWSVHWPGPLYPPGSWWCCHPCRLWLSEVDHPTLSSTCSCRDKTQFQPGIVCVLYWSLHVTDLSNSGWGRFSKVRFFLIEYLLNWIIYSRRDTCFHFVTFVLLSSTEDNFVFIIFINVWARYVIIKWHQMPPGKHVDSSGPWHHQDITLWVTCVREFDTLAQVLTHTNTHTHRFKHTCLDSHRGRSECLGVVWPGMNGEMLALLTNRFNRIIPLSAGGYRGKEAGCWLLYQHTNIMTLLHSHYLRWSEETRYMMSLAPAHTLERCGPPAWNRCLLWITSLGLLHELFSLTVQLFAAAALLCHILYLTHLSMLEVEH